MSVITIRVTREIKEKLEKHNVNVSETVRELLEKYLTELETRNLAQKLELLRERLSGKIDPKMVAQLVREDREKRRIIYLTHQPFYHLSPDVASY